MGWGPAKEPASQCARVCQNYPLQFLPYKRFHSDIHNKGVFIEKGPFFHGKGSSRAPQSPHDPPPKRGGGLLKIPVGAGGWCLCGIWGARTRCLYREKRPLFDENALILGTLGCAKMCSANPPFHKRHSIARSEFFFGSSQTWLFQTWLSDSLQSLCRSALLYHSAPFCALLCSFVFVFIFALFCAFACFCKRPRLERPRLGT